MLLMDHSCRDLALILALRGTHLNRLPWFTESGGWSAVVLGNHPISFTIMLYSK